MSTNLNSCTCGNDQPHIVARRRTADDVAVEIWHDGAITGRAGRALPNVPIARPRTEAGRLVAVAAASLVAGEIELYEVTEVPRLVACAKRVAARNGLPGDLRAAFAKESPVLRLVWQVYATDRDGTPTVRVAKLDRIRWPGLVVWHECGRYELLVEQCGMSVNARSRSALVPTGFSFNSQHELREHLFANRADS